MKDFKGNKQSVDMHGSRKEQYWQRKNKRDSKYNNAGNSALQNSTDYMKLLEEKFHFGGLEFGNWMSNSDRMDRCQALVNGLHDLHRVVKSDNYGMDGLLSLSFGGRGRGGNVAGHFEPWDNVINLTKTHKGVFVHEWTHAVDFIIGRMVDRNTDGSTPTTELSRGGVFSPKTKNYVIPRDVSRLREIAQTVVFERMAFPLPTRNAKYYREPTEILARTMEDYVAHELNAREDNILTKSMKIYQAYSVVYMTNDARRVIYPWCIRFMRELTKVLNS